MDKKSYNIRMNFEVPESEKQIAEKASDAFEDVVGLLRKGLDHLDIFYESFEDRKNVPLEQIYEYRAIFRNYRDKIKENFNNLINRVSICLVLMSEFSKDTAVFDLMNSFVQMIEDLKKSVNLLLLTFHKLDSGEFIPSALSGIKNVKQQATHVRNMVNDRILPHIDKNILAKNWTDIITDGDDNKLYNKLPLFVELFKRKNQVEI